MLPNYDKRIVLPIREVARIIETTRGVSVQSLFEKHMMRLKKYVHFDLKIFSMFQMILKNSSAHSDGDREINLNLTKSNII